MEPHEVVPPQLTLPIRVLGYLQLALAVDLEMGSQDTQIKDQITHCISFRVVEKAHLNVLAKLSEAKKKKK